MSLATDRIDVEKQETTSFTESLAYFGKHFTRYRREVIWSLLFHLIEMTPHLAFPVITMFIVDMDTPGLVAEPMDLLSSHNICSTYFDDVRVPESRMVGGLNQGWKLITGQLNHERVTICSPGMLESSYQEVLAWTRETRLADGRRVIDQEWAQINMARVHAGLEFLERA